MPIASADPDAFLEHPRAPYLARPPGCWCGPGDHDLFCPHWGKKRVWVQPPNRNVLGLTRLRTTRKKDHMNTVTKKELSVNKKDLAARVAIRLDVSEAVAYSVLNATIEEVQAAVSAGERVTMASFGTFEGRHRAARIGRNPRNGDEIPVPARTVPAFKVSEAFKERVAAAAAERNA